MNKLMLENNKYKEQINTQSMADLGRKFQYFIISKIHLLIIGLELLNFNEKELEKALESIIECEDIDQIKRQISILFNKLKANHKKTKILSPTLSIGMIQFLMQSDFNWNQRMLGKLSKMKMTKEIGLGDYQDEPRTFYTISFKLIKCNFPIIKP